MIKAACHKIDSDGKCVLIRADGFERVLHNIGASGRITRDEIETIVVEEMGEEVRDRPREIAIPADRLMKLI